MTQRITNAHLYRVLDMINRQAGFDPETVDIYTQGAYGFDMAYGGVKLIRYTGNSGESDVLPRGTKRECFDMMHAFYAGMVEGARNAA